MDRKLTSHPGGYEPVSLADVESPSVSAEPSPTVVVSSPTSPHSEKTSIQFAKAAFLFKDKLDDVRKNKRTTAVHEEEVLPTPLSPPAPLPPSSSPPEDPPEGEDSSDPIAARRLRILRLVQSTLTSFLSIAIAVLQGKAYLAYQRTKDTPGAWPTHPNLMPTTLLLVVGILAGAFDLSLLLAYLLPSRAKTLLGVATKSHNLLTCVKGVSYLLVSVVCRSGFDYGNASGQNNDLWGWTCSSAADQFADVTQAGANCDGQTAAWYIALAQIGIEGVGVFGTVFINQRSRKASSKGGRGTDEFPAAELEKMVAWGQELDKTLGGMTPQTGAKGDSS